ncbi:hypothetical protein [Pedobacter jeongneungensis]|uniref:hypothetical protein n=1 Tax=Pedobacter jeongneungensis TaxID=947309 RepID=UPI00046937C5|nr:hypothetical protein [Pedobacter jeongneungensis]
MKFNRINQNKMKHLLVILACFIALGCSTNPQNDKQLIGKWVGTLKDQQTGGSIEKIVLEFTKDGNFMQHLGEGDMQNTIESIYEIQNDKLICIDKQSKEKTEAKYEVKNDTLTIVLEGVENSYTKVK